MKKCPHCAEEIQDAAVVCRFCGRDPAVILAAPQPTPGYGLAVTGLVLGILSIPLLWVCGIGFLTAVLGFVLAIIARVVAARAPQGARGLATGAIVTNGVVLGLGVVGLVLGLGFLGMMGSLSQRPGPDGRSTQGPSETAARPTPRPSTTPARLQAGTVLFANGQTLSLERIDVFAPSTFMGRNDPVQELVIEERTVELGVEKVAKTVIPLRELRRIDYEEKPRDTMEPYSAKRCSCVLTRTHGTTFTLQGKPAFGTTADYGTGFPPQYTLKGDSGGGRFVLENLLRCPKTKDGDVVVAVRSIVVSPAR